MGNVAGRVDDELHDCPGDKNNDETDGCGGNNFLGRVHFVFVATGRKPDEAAVEDHDNGDEAEETQDEGDDVDDGFFKISRTEGQSTTDVFDREGRRSEREHEGPSGDCASDEFAGNFHVSTPFQIIRIVMRECVATSYIPPVTLRVVPITNVTMAQEMSTITKPIAAAEIICFAVSILSSFPPAVIQVKPP